MAGQSFVHWPFKGITLSPAGPLLLGGQKPLSLSQLDAMWELFPTRLVIQAGSVVWDLGFRHNLLQLRYPFPNLSLSPWDGASPTRLALPNSLEVASSVSLWHSGRTELVIQGDCSLI